MTDNNNEKHKIVIVGGGAAGLELATSLGKKLGKKGAAEVTLLDASPIHIWKPLLHEVAAGTLDESEQIEYLAQAYRNHFRFRLGRMEGLDRQKKEIYVSPTLSDSGEELIPRRTFSYDTLVMAVGSISNTFNIKGVAEHCLFLDTTAQAFKFQRQLVESYIKSHASQSADKSLSIVIIGAGATGVELSAQLHEVTNLLAVYGLDESSDVKLTIIEAATQLLPALPGKLAQATQQQLVKLGVDLKLGRRVIEVSKEGVLTHDDEMIPADLKVWSAGIKAPDWMQNLDGLEVNRINQLVVDATLKTSDDNIFAIGDCAACPWPGHDGNVPPRAQAAHQQASTLGKSIINRLQGGKLVNYVYLDYGSLVALGKYTTVGNLMGNLMGSVSVGGFIARMVYLSLYKMHQVAIHGYFRTAMLTLSNLFRRSAHATIKMH
ncbi:MAG: NAD(P)/FAD-dependent oxidoreductase [Methylobacter sp.]|nr:NAD(P)/FAD-dependent oxidoreductase [Methylobacter sp.]MDP2430060.1 NAD(P)/FAD-dependent oxidoreductase [Methylobacter sp.]MDP3056875.1 NAD(P)/FAD-dependent oxidoreductase [Methylobacter sp.]MDP3364370.1 NAD(P)/FAD-dependent oxidoreductase [Methylobacter sp.]MDZ4221084.1 NAD(P)/FAD-dependent oxidoreductase [Methylobacter sp.]